MAISERELKRRLYECGGISPDDEENDAVIALFDKLDAESSARLAAEGENLHLFNVNLLTKQMLAALRLLKKQGVYHHAMDTMIEQGIKLDLAIPE